MNIKKSIGKIAAISVVAFSVLGCEQDFETLGSNIIGEPGFNAVANKIFAKLQNFMQIASFILSLHAVNF